MTKLAKQHTDLEIDSYGRCLYFKIGNEKIAKTLEYNEFINIDLNKNNEPVGIEFIALGEKLGHEF